MGWGGGGGERKEGCEEEREGEGRKVGGVRRRGKEGGWGEGEGVYER